MTDATPNSDSPSGAPRRTALRGRWSLTAREILFRLLCQHRQGAKPNILLYCVRRGGSTWLLNTLAAHPGMRYVGRPLLTIRQTRHARCMPSLEAAAGDDSGHQFIHPIRFEGEAEAQFRRVAADMISGRLEIYPSINVRAPYFQRKTNRIVFQMTSGHALIEWFDANFDVDTVVLYRHPIPTALSIMKENWRPRSQDFLRHAWFARTQLTDEQRSLAWSIEEGDDLLARHVLDWSLQMLTPTRALRAGNGSDWIVITYEAMVLRPDEVVRECSRRLELPSIDLMLAQAHRPSRTVSAGTAGHTDDAAYLLRRWRDDIGPQREAELLSIPAAFGLPLYQPGEDEAAQLPGRADDIADRTASTQEVESGAGRDGTERPHDNV